MSAQPADVSPSQSKKAVLLEFPGAKSDYSAGRKIWSITVCLHRKGPFAILGEGATELDAWVNAAANLAEDEQSAA